MVALPGSTDPDVAIFLDGLGVRPGVEVEIREKHPFDGPLVVSVDGHDRTIGEKVARQILVRTETTNHKRRKEPLIMARSLKAGTRRFTCTAPSGSGWYSPPPAG